MALKFPEIFRIAGCWFVDRTAERKNEVEYKLEYLNKNKAVKKSISKKIRLKESQPVSPSALTVKSKMKVSFEMNYPMEKHFSDLTTQLSQKITDRRFPEKTLVLIIGDTEPPILISQCKLELNILLYYCSGYCLIRKHFNRLNDVERCETPCNTGRN